MRWKRFRRFTRLKRHFCWYPKLYGDEYIWLESIYYRQILYVDTWHGISMWKTLETLTKPEYDYWRHLDA